MPTLHEKEDLPFGDTCGQIVLHTNGLRKTEAVVKQHEPPSHGDVFTRNT